MKKPWKTGLLVTSAAALVAGAGAALLAPRTGQPGWESFTPYRYAHRGLHNVNEGRPENSLSAFRAAVERGFGAELDVHLMRDGNLAVVHDSDLTRVTGKTAIVEELTAEELAGYPLTGSGETIPLFGQVLEVFDGKTPLIVELKTRDGNAQALTDAAIALLEAHQVTYCVESFDPRAVMYLKQRYPQVIRGQLSENFLRSGSSDISPLTRAAMTYLATTGLTKPDFIAYNHAHRNNASLRLMKRLYGVHEVSWTVRDADTLRELEAEGALVIFEGFVPE